ncbi:hypothetical protein EVG20_g3523 [Dentipellis fragilis]|uniref:NAD(P)-binding domain-containing protein n=1 Tax=Dentipellis fragilis TaxID=205917 RepID=A0A4Y9Z3H5_9AGAM|nr:hypothetical protein EVG20_g3523 [Dentipellis fragilis]
MSTPKIQVLITGATGYIGGTVVQLLLAHPKRDTFEITAYVRSEEKAKVLQTFGLKTAIGTFNESDKLTDLASKADVVINIADADHFAGNKALLNGLKKRYESTKKVPAFIHTSGTGVLNDDALGDRISDTIYYDSKPEQLDALPDTQIHRDVDLEIIGADKAGYARTYIIFPGTIYGTVSGKLVDTGITNRHSVQVPGLIKASLHRGNAAVVGEGKNIWPHVEINDVAQLFVIIFDAALADSAPHGREGIFFAENGEYQLIDVSKEVAKAFYDLGIQNSPEPTPLAEAEVAAYGAQPLGANCRARGERSRALGWKPTKTTEDFIASIRPEVEAIVAQFAQK